MESTSKIKEDLEGLKFIANAGRIDRALTYIQQLEAENTKLHEANVELCRTAGRLEQERDAAVKDLQTCAPCRVCKFRNRGKDDYPCDDCGFHAASNFEWRGPQEVTP